MLLPEIISAQALDSSVSRHSPQLPISWVMESLFCPKIEHFLSLRYEEMSSFVAHLARDIINALSLLIDQYRKIFSES